MSIQVSHWILCFETMKEVERDRERVEGKKNWEKPIGLKRKASRKFFYLAATSEEGFAPPGQVRCCVGSVVRSGNLSKNTSKNALKSLLCQRCTSLCQPVSCCGHRFQVIPGEMINSWLLLTRRQRENKWGIKHLHLHLPAVTTHSSAK